MKILITGSKGQLGNALRCLINNDDSMIGRIPPCYSSCEIIAVDIDDLDITDRKAVLSFVTDKKPNIIVNCAAMTNVDGCESNAVLADSINAHGPENLAIAAESVGAKFVHISTDYVFRGDSNVPYVESDACDPVTEYGKSKLHGEQLAAANSSRLFIMRTSWLYGLVGKKFCQNDTEHCP